MKIAKAKAVSFLFSALFVLSALSVSVYAWFYFPLTQNTSVYTDGVIDIDLKAYVYDFSENGFGEKIIPSGTPAVIHLEFIDENGETKKPYFFLWDGQYTTNDVHATIYKFVADYGNEAEAFPSRMALYGDFDFHFQVTGDDGESIAARFMKVSYLIPENGETETFLDPSLYTPVASSDYAAGIRALPLGGAGSGASFAGDYTMTFYLILETDLGALNENAGLLADEYGLLDAQYDIDIKLYCRTLPANP